eukprot:11775206-Heterocapsa_arctica.AAC.1
MPREGHRRHAAACQRPAVSAVLANGGLVVDVDGTSVLTGLTLVRRGPDGRIAFLFGNKYRVDKTACLGTEKLGEAPSTRRGSGRCRRSSPRVSWVANPTADRFALGIALFAENMGNEGNELLWAVEGAPRTQRSPP